MENKDIKDFEITPGDTANSAIVVNPAGKGRKTNILKLLNSNTTVSTSPPSGVPREGQQWIIYE